MKLSHSSLIGLLIFPLSTLAQPDSLQTQLSQDAKTNIQTFAGSLKQQLQLGMKSGGPLNAINVCNFKANEISELHSKEGWQLKRTSLKVRNAKNTPTDYEVKILQSFATRKQQGEPIANIDHAEIQGDDFYYMKAIPTKAVCLTCHGDNIAEPVKQRLSQLYPDDQATGFQLGDIRGAFTLIKKLHGEKQ